MGGVNVGGAGGGGRKALDTEINMIPMIDLLMVTISFLLITAVWVQSSRLDANANVPGPTESPPCSEGEPSSPCKPEPRLHVLSNDPSKFVLAWKEGATTVRSVEVPREARTGSRAAFPALAARVAEEWRTSGAHRDASDRRFDRAVVHASNDMPYGEIVAVMDAVAKPQRTFATGDKVVQTSAFETTFATD